MTIPISATPVLEGKDAEEWWNKVKSEEKIPFGYVPTPELEEVRKEILANAKQKKRKVTKIPFGELNLTLSQINKMAKVLWETNNSESEYETVLPWTKLRDRVREEFIREFILTIPKVLGTVGLKVTKK